MEALKVDTKETESTKQLTPSDHVLLEMYKECGQHMRFYSDARFKIMTLALAVGTLLISIQQLLPELGLVFGLIGLLATAVLFSLEYRYHQAWATLIGWTERNVEDRLFGNGHGPLNSYQFMSKPWYVMRSKVASNSLYFLLLLIWSGNTIHYIVKLITDQNP